MLLPEGTAFFVSENKLIASPFNSNRPIQVIFVVQ
jgi:hypothetical protein